MSDEAQRLAAEARRLAETATPEELPVLVAMLTESLVNAMNTTAESVAALTRRIETLEQERRLEQEIERERRG